MDRERLLKLVSAGLMLAFVALCTCALTYLLVSELNAIQEINQDEKAPPEENVIQEINQDEKAPPEEKLKVLRHELHRPLTTVQGVTTLLKRKNASNGLDPKELDDLINRLAKATDELQEILDTLTQAERT